MVRVQLMSFSDLANLVPPPLSLMDNAENYMVGGRRGVVMLYIEC